MAVVPDHEIIPRVLASIARADYLARPRSGNPYDRDCSRRYAAAADKLRDFATVELMCEGLGITRKELK